MKILVHVTIVLLGVALLGATSARAQCVNTVVPSCGVYDSCFAKYCPCASNPAEYFITYGKKYCERFLARADLSDAGKVWRDRTLSCLQETIVPHLDISSNPTCDCGAMRQIAFDSHVACYTQAGASICDLPLADLTRIAQTIDTDDYFTAESLRQIKAVAAICLGIEDDAERRSLWARF